MARTISHWVGLAAAVIPIPFEISDAIRLDLIHAEPLVWLLAGAYAVALSVLLYGIGRGVGWLVARGRKAPGATP